MMLRLNRSDYRLALYMVGFTLVWGIIGLLWSCQPAVHGFGGLGEWDASRIRSAFPHYVVDPALAAEGIDDLLGTWMVTEIETRLALVVGIWLLGIVVLWFVHRRSRRTEVRRITTWTPR